MSKTPAVNPNVNDIADRAKYAYATATQRLATMQYRLGELAGTGELDPDDSMSLQENLLRIWEALYSRTLCAVRDRDTEDSTWDEADNTYSDGRQVMIQLRIEPEQYSDFSWEHNRFTLGDGAINEYPLGTISYIAPVNPDDEVVADPPHRPPLTDFDALRKRVNHAVAQRISLTDNAAA